MLVIICTLLLHSVAQTPLSCGAFISYSNTPTHFWMVYYTEPGPTNDPMDTTNGVWLQKYYCDDDPAPWATWVRLPRHPEGRLTNIITYFHDGYFTPETPGVLFRMVTNSFDYDWHIVSSGTNYGETNGACTNCPFPNLP